MKVLRMSVSVLVVLFLTVGVYYDVIGQETAMEHYSKGEDYLFKGMYDEAIAEFTKAIEIDPRLLEGMAYNNRGEAYLAKGQYDQAVSDFTKCIEIFPEDHFAYRNRGFAYNAKGQYDQAVSDFTRAIEINPKYSRAYYDRGFAYFKKGQYDQAISDFTQAIHIYDQAIADDAPPARINELSPVAADAYYSRGVVYGKKGQFDQAIADFTKAIKIKPGYAEAHYYRALSYYSKGEYDEAWRDVHKAQDLGINVPPKFLDELRKASGRDG